MKKYIHKENVKKLFGFFILLLIIITILFFLGIFKKPCFDEICFQKALEKCKSTEIIRQKSNNLYVYSIFPSLGEDCKIQVTLKRIAPGSDPEIVHLLEGKSMQCKIPRILLQRTDIDNVENILQYCHGELKEGILQLIIKKMYASVIGNLDDIVKKSQETVNEKMK